jgi:hypothetical protein
MISSTMRSYASILLALTPQLSLAVPRPAPSFTPAPGNFPSKGDGDFAGGIFR